MDNDSKNIELKDGTDSGDVPEPVKREVFAKGERKRKD